MSRIKLKIYEWNTNAQITAWFYGSPGEIEGEFHEAALEEGQITLSFQSCYFVHPPHSPSMYRRVDVTQVELICYGNKRITCHSGYRVYAL